MKSDVQYLSFPACEQHSSSNKWANRILEKSPLMFYLRAIVYIGAIFGLAVLIALATTPGTFSRLGDMGALLIFPIVGWLGIATILWARRTTSVWPIRFDPDMDVIEIRFSDAGYAAEFRRLNRDATDEQLTKAPRWYLRALPWKVLIIVVFLLLMGRLLTH